jgi:hypothetical protein
MAFPHPDQAWIYGYKHLYLSTDKGDTWVQKSLPDDSLANLIVTAHDTLVLFTNGLLPSTKGYYVSTDAAQSWQFYNLGLDSTSKGFVLNDRYLFVSQYGGVNHVYRVDRQNNNSSTEVFTAQPGEQILDLAFTTPLLGYLLVQKIDGAYVYQTSNGGQDWSSYGPYPYIENLKLTYNLNGFAYGDYGRLLKLADGLPVNISQNPRTGSGSIQLKTNPVNNWAEFLVSSDNPGDGVIQIYDLQFKLLLSKKVERLRANESLSVNVDGLPSGTYIVNYVGKQEILSCRFVKL